MVEFRTLTIVRVVADVSVLAFAVFLSFSALKSWLGFAGGFLVWRRRKTDEEGWPAWPSGRPGVQARSWREFNAPAGSPDEPSERERIAARNALYVSWGKGAAAAACAGLFVVVDRFFRFLGG
jgi:hypothetical protein